MPSRQFQVVIGVAALAVLASLAYAADTGRSQRVAKEAKSEAYQPTARSTAYRTELSGVESSTDLSNAAITGLDTVGCAGFQNLTVSGRFATSGANAVVHVILYHTDGSTETVKHRYETTLTAGSTWTDAAGAYLSQGATFDTGSSHLARVLVESVSAGTLDLWVDSH